MKKTLKFLSMFLTLVLVFSFALSVSAKTYPKAAIASSSDFSNFVQPGDMDADKVIDNDDVIALKALIMNDTTTIYSDTNGVNGTDICDLVFQDEQSEVAYNTFYDNTKVSLTGRSVYKDMANFTAGVQYQLTGADGITVKLNGTVISNNAYFTAPKNLKTAEFTIYSETGATVTNLKVTRTSAMDNDYSVSNF